LGIRMSGMALNLLKTIYYGFFELIKMRSKKFVFPFVLALLISLPFLRALGKGKGENWRGWEDTTSERGCS